MFRLRTLGQVDLRDADGLDVGAILVQPKRLGLLAYLAYAATGAFLRRDLLLPVFWAELPEPRARNALRQAVHQLRRALGPEVVVARGADMLGVDGARLWCDACAFEAALARGALDDALALYGGDLLPGFAIDDAPEFDRWLEDTRVSLRDRAARSAWALADRRERAGDAAGAVECARRAMLLGIHDEAGVRQLVALFDRLGDAAGALEAYPAFAHRLQRDTGAEPSVETQALVAAIRERSNGHAMSLRGVPPALMSASGTRTARHPLRVTIEPFVNLGGDAGADFIGRLVCDVIAQGVLESRTVDVVTADRPRDPSAARPETGFLVTGNYLMQGDTWRFHARFSDWGGRVLDTIQDVTAPRGQPWDAADELRRRISGMLASRMDPRLASLANAVGQAPDPQSHRELAIGVDLHLRGDFRAAVPYLLRASGGGTGFTLGSLWAIQASCNLGEWEQAEAILAELTARRRHGGFSALERLACDYFTACLDGQQGEALRIVRMAAELVPGSELLSQLGRAALLCNQPRAAVEALERLDPERGWIPSWTPHWRRLTEARHMLGEHERELDAARRGRRYHPEAISAILYEARAQAALGDLAALADCIDEASAFPPDPFADAGLVMLDAARELRAHGRSVEGVALAERAVAWYRDQDGDGERVAGNRRALARACYECGCWCDVAALVRELVADSPDDVELIGLGGATAARLGDDRAARDVVQRLRSKTGRFRFGTQYAWMARILAVLGDAHAAVAALQGGFARGYGYGIELHADPDLALLGHVPAFRDLLRPKG